MRWLGRRPYGPRHRDEPGRPSARRRRGPLEGQPPADAVGQAHQGLQDAAQQADERSSSSSGGRAARATEQRRPNVARSVKKGPFVDLHLIKKVQAMIDVGREARRQDLVAPLDDHARHGRLHVRRPQRAQVHPGVRHRERRSATSSASSRRRARSTATPATARPRSRAPRPRRARPPERRRLAHGSSRKHPLRAPDGAEGAPGRRPDPRPAASRRRSASSQFTPKRGAKIVAEDAASAVANAEHGAARRRRRALRQKRVCVDEGPTGKRFLPRAHGRATPVFKRTQPHHRRRRRAPSRRGG